MIETIMHVVAHFLFWVSLVVGIAMGLNAAHPDPLIRIKPRAYFLPTFLLAAAAVAKYLSAA